MTPPLNNADKKAARAYQKAHPGTPLNVAVRKVRDSRSLSGGSSQERALLLPGPGSAEHEAWLGGSRADRYGIGRIVGSTVDGESEGDVAFADLTDSAHMLISGPAGSGKTRLLTSVAYATACNAHRYDLVMIDSQAREHQWVRNLPNTIAYAVGGADSGRDALDAITTAHQAMVRNSAHLIEMRRENFQQLGRDTLPHRVMVMVDEAHLTLAEPRDAAARDAWHETRTLVEQIAAMGRAMGVHLIVACQDPHESALGPSLPHQFGVGVEMGPPHPRTAARLGLSATPLQAKPGQAVLCGPGDAVRVVQTYFTPRDMTDAALERSEAALAGAGWTRTYDAAADGERWVPPVGADFRAN